MRVCFSLSLQLTSLHTLQVNNAGIATRSVKSEQQTDDNIWLNESPLEGDCLACSDLNSS